MRPSTSDHLATGKLPGRCDYDHPIASPYGLFTARDGDIAVAPSTEAILRRFLTAIGAVELLDGPRFLTNADRVRERRALDALINVRMVAQSQALWIERLNQAGVPCGRVQDIGQVIADPQIIDQQMIIDVEHPGHGSVRMLGLPVKLSHTPCVIRHPAPALGAHNDEVFGEVAAGETLD